MKTSVWRALRLLTLLPLLVSAPVAALADEECDETYYRIDAAGNETPVAQPSPPLAHLLASARAGDAKAQRSLAASYEAGYRVSRCHAKALYWYQRAAHSGDTVAQNWLRQNGALARLHAADECSGPYCAAAAGDGPQLVTLLPDPRRSNHYFARVTINGRSAEGMIDTGASTLAMSAETARRFGIDTTKAKAATATTANGSIATSNVVVPQVDVAGINLTDVAVSVGVSGEMLIGMSFLRRLNMTMSGGALTLRKP